MIISLYGIVHFPPSNDIKYQKIWEKTKNDKILFFAGVIDDTSFSVLQIGTRYSNFHPSYMN